MTGCDDGHIVLLGKDGRGFADFSGNEHIIAALVGFFEFGRAAACADGDLVLLPGFEVEALVTLGEHLGEEFVCDDAYAAYADIVLHKAVVDHMRH